MINQKLEPLLNVALAATSEERSESPLLSSGVSSDESLWDLIVRYTGSFSSLLNACPAARGVELLGGYATLQVPKSCIEPLAALPQVMFVEKPKPFYFSLARSQTASCLTAIRRSPYSLTGQNVAVGIVDSGIDIFHPDFRNSNGQTRIKALWDQSLSAAKAAELGIQPPVGYQMGGLFSESDIQTLLQTNNRTATQDRSGHGTAVAGIAAGNGRASNGQYTGYAPEADLIVVKLAAAQGTSFPRTIEVMQGIDFLVKTAVQMQQPLALNLSFGNSYGSHDGTSLIETFLDAASDVGQTTIVVGSGNEGNRAGHAGGFLSPERTQRIDLSVDSFQTTFSIQLWKAFTDVFSIALESPAGERISIDETVSTARYLLGRDNVFVYYGTPSPYSQSQEIFLELRPLSSYITSGIWRFYLIPKRILTGRYDFWLPAGGVLNQFTNFLRPDPDITLTIPSTAAKAVTVGAYNLDYFSYADYSGRGLTRNPPMQKPDLSAPGTNITAPAVGGGYASVTGTSFAAPAVTGSAALLMQWGIVQKNDPFLFGEKLKAWLCRGAKSLPAGQEIPNPQVGFGALCVEQSFFSV